MRVFSLTGLAASLILYSAVAAHAQQPPYLAGLHVAPSPASAAASPANRAFFLTPEIAKELPRLGERFTVLAPSSKDYNGYSYVLGVTDRWLVPEAGTAQNPFAGMDKFMAQGGYRRLPTMDTSPRHDAQKVAVFAKLQPDGDIAQVTHAALLGADGKWTCKPGGLPLIQIDDLSVLRGPSYGLPVAVYERTSPMAPAPAVPIIPTIPSVPVRY
jgi:type VI secretion system secreted protein VgrG